MADSSNARGSVRATGRKSARKTGTASSPTKPAGKSPKASPAKTSAPPRVGAQLPTAERQRMIAEAAYYLAQRRGSTPGNPHQDWLQAEAEIDAMLLRRLADD